MKIQEGEDFETFRVSEDNESVIGKSEIGAKGAAIGANDSPFDEVVYLAAVNMNVGDVELVRATAKDSDGNDVDTYYIVKRVEGTTGIVPYAEVKSVIDSTLESYATSTYYNEQVDAWREKATIVIDDDAVNAFDPAA